MLLFLLPLCPCAKKNAYERVQYFFNVTLEAGQNGRYSEYLWPFWGATGQMERLFSDFRLKRPYYGVKFRYSLEFYLYLNI